MAIGAQVEKSRGSAIFFHTRGKWLFGGLEGGLAEGRERGMRF